jgi:hypothetical protein
MAEVNYSSNPPATFKYLPTFPAGNPPPPPSDWGTVAPGYTDLADGYSPEARRRILNSQAAIGIADALINRIYGTITPSPPGSQPIVAPKGFPGYGAYGRDVDAGGVSASIGSLSRVGPLGITNAQWIVIVVLGGLLLIGITKG